MNKRLDSFDIAKGIAILCVILGHLGIYNIVRTVYVFHMPIFFIISGYFLSQRQEFKTFCKNKARGLLLPYYCTCFFICILSIPLAIFLKHSVLKTVWNWIGGSLYAAGIVEVHGLIPHMPIFIGALWFLWALFWGLLAVRWILDTFPEKYHLLIIASVAWIGYQTAQTIWLPLDIQAGLTAMIFIYIGYVAKKEQVLSRPHSPAILALCIGTVAWCIKYFKGFGMVSNYYGNGLMNIFGALAATYLILLVCGKLENLSVLSSVLTWYGRNSIIILAFHIIELDLLPWNQILIFIQRFGLSKTIALLGIVALKITWATTGVFVVKNIPLLRKVYVGK